MKPELEISENKAEERIKQDLIKENIKMENVFSADGVIKRKFKKERQMNFDNRIINRKRKLKGESNTYIRKKPKQGKSDDEVEFTKVTLCYPCNRLRRQMGKIKKECLRILKIG